MSDDLRELSIEIIKNRLIRDKDTLGLKGIYRNNDTTITKENVPVIYIYEGDDTVEKYKNTRGAGYPLLRKLELNIEIVSNIDRDGKEIRRMFNEVRKSVFCERSGSEYSIKEDLLVGSFIREIRSKGPNLYSIPNIIGCIIVLGLFYTDHGFLS
jgi:hypothetical protein